jgi:hypothetical protein
MFTCSSSSVRREWIWEWVAVVDLNLRSWLCPEMWTPCGWKILWTVWASHWDVEMLWAK